MKLGDELPEKLSYALGVLVIGYLLILLTTGKQDHGALFFLAGVATAGWLYTADVARRNQKEKNTFDLIYSYNRDQRYISLREAVWRAYGSGVKIDRSDAEKLVDEYFGKTIAEGEAFPAGYHLSQVANFYEYLAMGIDTGILSEKVARRYFSATLRQFYDVKAAHFIAIVRERKCGAKSTAYIELLALVRKWHPDATILKP